MSPKIPVLKARDLVHILERHGFVRVRQSGSHLILRHADGRRVTVSMHTGRDIGRGLLRQIMRDAELTVEDLVS